MAQVAMINNNTIPKSTAPHTANIAIAASSPRPVADSS